MDLTSFSGSKHDSHLPAKFQLPPGSSRFARHTVLATLLSWDEKLGISQFVSLYLWALGLANAPPLVRAFRVLCGVSGLGVFKHGFVFDSTMGISAKTESGCILKPPGILGSRV